MGFPGHARAGRRLLRKPRGRGRGRRFRRMVPWRDARAGSSGSRARRAERAHDCVSASPVRPGGAGAASPIPVASHDFHRLRTLGGSTLKNGELLLAAEGAGFTVFATTDNLKYQHNLGARRIAIVVLSTTSWPRIRLVTEQVAQVIDGGRLPGATPK